MLSEGERCDSGRYDDDEDDKDDEGNNIMLYDLSNQLKLSLCYRR